MAAFDWPEFWNPKVRAADCMNPQAARFVLPIAFLRSRMVMAGRSKTEILSAIVAAFENGQLPNLESGAMDYLLPAWTLRIGELARRARRSCRPPIGSSRRRNHPK
jgi:hypothetical protein